MKFSKIIEWTAVRTPLVIILVVIIFGTPVYLLGRIPCVVFFKEEKATYISSDHSQADNWNYVFESTNIRRYPIDKVSFYDNEKNLIESDFYIDDNRLYLKAPLINENLISIRINFSNITIIDEIFRSK